MKLSDKEKQLISIIELDASLSVEKLAKKLKIKTHSVRYFQKKLISQGVISLKRPIIDMAGLGYNHYNFFFSLSSNNSKKKEEVLNFLRSLISVTWIFEVGADYQYGVSFSVKSAAELTSELTLLSKRFGDIIFDKTYSLQLSFVYFGRRYLAKNLKEAKRIDFKNALIPTELTPDEETILTVLANKDCESMKKYAEVAKIPLPTFERKRKSLEDRKIIKGYFHWVNGSTFNMQSYIILVSLKGLSSSFKDQLVELSNNEPHVIYLTECIGGWDFELGIEVENNFAVTLITQKLYDNFPKDIKNIKVIPILNYLKFRSYTLDLSFA